MHKRPHLGKTTREFVLAEFHNRCALGQGEPQIHHIDGDNANNDPLNLIPLCPNHHLTDQHGKGKAFTFRQLWFFRRIKDRKILSRQFRPICDLCEPLLGSTEHLSEEQLLDGAAKLSNFISGLVQGGYFSGELRRIYATNATQFIGFIDDAGESWNQWKAMRLSEEVAYKAKVKACTGSLVELLNQLVAYQQWPEPETCNPPAR